MGTDAPVRLRPRFLGHQPATASELIEPPFLRALAWGFTSAFWASDSRTHFITAHLTCTRACANAEPQAFAHVGRTLLSDAFDVDLDVNFAFDSNREGHGFSRAEKQSFESARLQAAP